MQKATTLNRKEIAMSHNLELLGYLATRSSRKAMMLYQQNSDFISKYNDYKNCEKELKKLESKDIGTKKSKKIAKLT